MLEWWMVAWVGLELWTLGILCCWDDNQSPLQLELPALTLALANISVQSSFKSALIILSFFNSSCVLHFLTIGFGQGLVLTLTGFLEEWRTCGR